MRHFTLVVFVALFWLSAGTATAQSPAQLCVAKMESGPGANAGQELLLKFLDKEKDKSVAQELPLDSSEPAQALEEAKKAHCDYLVTTKQTESHQENSIMTGSFGNVSTPTFYVATAYKLTRVSDGSEVLSGNLKASDHSSEQTAIGLTMHKVADKVTEAIKKAGH